MSQREQYRLDRTKRAVLRFLFNKQQCTENRLAELFQCSVGTVRRHIANKSGDDISEDMELVHKWRTEAEASSSTQATTGDNATKDESQEAKGTAVAPSGASGPPASASTADTQRLRILLPPSSSSQSTAEQPSATKAAPSEEPANQDRVAKRPHDATSMNGTSSNQDVAANGDTAKQPEPKRPRAEASTSRQAESPERALATTVGRGSAPAAASGTPNGTGAQLPSISAPVPLRKIEVAMRQSEPRSSVAALRTPPSDVDMENGGSRSASSSSQRSDDGRAPPPQFVPADWTIPALANVDPGVVRYVEALGLPAELYAPKLVSIGLKNEAILNATRNFVSETQKARLENALQTTAGLSFAEALILMAGLR